MDCGDEFMPFLPSAQVKNGQVVGIDTQLFGFAGESKIDCCAMQTLVEQLGNR
jgi:hypothetical protein